MAMADHAAVAGAFRRQKSIEHGRSATPANIRVDPVYAALWAVPGPRPRIALWEPGCGGAPERLEAPARGQPVGPGLGLGRCVVRFLPGHALFARCTSPVRSEPLLPLHTKTTAVLRPNLN